MRQFQGHSAKGCAGVKGLSRLQSITTASVHAAARGSRFGKYLGSRFGKRKGRWWLRRLGQGVAVQVDRQGGQVQAMWWRGLGC